MTQPVDGPPNVQVCLHSDEQGFLNLLLSRIAAVKNTHEIGR
jgi:hypothetical protein